MPLNSIDIAYRNAKDVIELMEIADKATTEWRSCADGNDLSDAIAECARFEKIRDRRAKEDADK